MHGGFIVSKTSWWGDDSLLSYTPHTSSRFEFQKNGILSFFGISAISRKKKTTKHEATITPIMHFLLIITKLEPPIFHTS